MGKAQILIVEDDRALGDVLQYNIEQAGCDVTLARDGLDGLHQARTHVPDLLRPGPDVAHHGWAWRSVGNFVRTH